MSDDDLPWLDPRSDAPPGAREMLRAAKDELAGAPDVPPNFDAWLEQETAKQARPKRRPPILALSAFGLCAAAAGAAMVFGIPRAKPRYSFSMVDYGDAGSEDGSPDAAK